MEKAKVDIWIDFSNPPHVNLFRPFIKHFKDRGLITYSTARNFAETTGLLDKYGINYHSFGQHGGKNRLYKILNLIKRNYLLFKHIPDFKVCISSSFEAPEISWLQRKPAIVFDDNETAPNWLYAKFARHIIAPEVIDITNWQKNGIGKKKVITYSGFKEDIYIADYIPDVNFLASIPFNKFITIRPENIFASYVPKHSASIVPGLIRSLSNNGFNILFLPRYEIDRTYVQDQRNIFIPKKPLNGLDVVYYSDAVLTGAGTFAREAAILGTPAVSFFAGKELLSVDRSMIEKGSIFFSRNIHDIVDYLKNKPEKKSNHDTSRSKRVQEEVFKILMNIYNSYV